MLLDCVQQKLKPKDGNSYVLSFILLLAPRKKETTADPYVTCLVVQPSEKVVQIFVVSIAVLTTKPFSPLRATVRSRIPDTPLKSRQNTAQAYDPSFITVPYIMTFFFNIQGIGGFAVGLCMRCKNIIIAFPGLEG